MNGKYLLDTNIIIALFAGDAAVQQRLREAGQVFISSIALGELYYGAQKSMRVRDNVRRIDEFALSAPILGCDHDTEYGRIKNRLRARGRPIPENDIWIAAQARQHRLVLVARDDHFLEVDELVLESW